MKWHDATKHKPKDKSSIWVWNIIAQKQELFIANWVDGQWDHHKLPTQFARMWAYVFDESAHETC